MDIDKLIEQLRTESLYKDKATLEIMDLCVEAAYAISKLQAENAQLLAELEQAKREGMSMERLTYWCDDGQGGGEWRVNIYGREESGPHVNRLAAYEDTGLEPEEVVKMGMMLEDSKRYSGRLELKLKLASVVLEEMKNG